MSFEPKMKENLQPKISQIVNFIMKFRFVFPSEDFKEPSVYTDDLHDDLAPLDFAVSDWKEVDQNLKSYRTFGLTLKKVSRF